MTGHGWWNEDVDTTSALAAREYKDSVRLVTHALTAEGADASEDGTGRGTPLVVDQDPIAFHLTQDPISGDVVPAIGRKSGGQGIAFALRGREDGAVPEIHEDGSTVGGIRAASGGSSRDYVAFDHQAAGNETSSGAFEEGTGITPTLAKNRQGIAIQAPALGVRRLTPTECARLQGLPDQWLDGYSDAFQYRALGDSVAVPVVEWIAKRLVAHINAQEGAA